MMDRVRTPAASCCLGAVLVLDFATLPDASTVGEFKNSLFESGRRRCCGIWPGDYFVTRTDDGFELSQEWSGSYDMIYTRYSRYEAGFWSPTREHDNVGMKIYAASTPYSAEESEAIRILLADRVAAEWDREIGARIRDSEWSRSRMLPLGYLHNAAAMLVLSGFVCSFLWVGDLWRSETRRDRRRRGLCAGCGYPMGGLPEPVCPECGERVGERFA